MAHYGLLGNYITDDPAQDIRNKNLYGSNDDKLGTIRDVIFDHATGDIAYVVVDTGGWLRTKNFVVPAPRLRVSPRHKGGFICDLTKEQVESFPPYEEGDLSSSQKWTGYENRYHAAWEAFPIVHRTELKPSTAAPGEDPMGPSWIAFQALLRQRRKELITQCPSCTETDDLKKAG